MDPGALLVDPGAGLADEELELLAVIFPEMALHGRAGEYRLPMDFPDGVAVAVANTSEQATLHHLPAVVLAFELPSTYPRVPPLLLLTCLWMPPDQLDALRALANSVWQQLHDVCVFLVVDQLQSQLHQLTAVTVDSASTLTSLVHFAALKSEAEFSHKWLECEVCQTSYLGSECMQMPGCGHVFCTKCLRDYVADCIASGNMDRVHCPSFECTKKAHEQLEKWSSREAAASDAQDAQDTGSTSILDALDAAEAAATLLTPPMDPGVLSQLCSEQQIHRYHLLFRLKRFAVFQKLYPLHCAVCPVSRCAYRIVRTDTDDLLVVCPRCLYAFCATCEALWHGINPCAIRRSRMIPSALVAEYVELQDAELAKELIQTYGKFVFKMCVSEYEQEQLFRLYCELQTVPCPTCKTPIGKLDGCNHMMCVGCRTHFCYVCGKAISSNTPYEHFTLPDSLCYGLLFQGMPGSEEP